MQLVRLLKVERLHVPAADDAVLVPLGLVGVRVDALDVVEVEIVVEGVHGRGGDLERLQSADGRDDGVGRRHRRDDPFYNALNK